MLIIDIDNAEEYTAAKLREFALKCPGVWGFKIRNRIRQHGAHVALTPYLHHLVMVDDKIYDTADTVESVVKLYAQMRQPPEFLTVSGAVTQRAIARAVEHRGSINIIVTTVFSDATDEDTQQDCGLINQFLFYHRELKARRGGAQGITCPAYLLSHVRYNDWHVLATGTRSTLAAKHNHYQTKTFEEVFGGQYRATHAVVGREVIEARDPERTLLGLAATCERAKQTPQAA